MSHVFVMPSRPVTAIDTAIPDASGVMRGEWTRKTREELDADYPGVQVLTTADYWKGHDDALRTAPERITDDEYHDALDALPPRDWQPGPGSQSFKFSEFVSGGFTWIYARHRGRYWKFCDSHKLTHEDILRRVDAFIAGEGVQAKTA